MATPLDYHPLYYFWVVATRATRRLAARPAARHSGANRSRRGCFRVRSRHRPASELTLAPVRFLGGS